MNFTPAPFSPALPHAPPRFRAEVRAMLLLSAPLAGALLAQMGMGTTDTILLGSLGRDALAAGGLGAAMFFFFAGLMQAACGGIGILIAHARGADDHARIAPILRAGFALAAVLTVPVVIAMAAIEPMLDVIGEAPELSRAVARFDRVLMLGAPAALALAALRMYLAAMDKPRYVLLVALGGLAGNAVLNYGLIYGAWGLPELGYLGSATATAIAVWSMLTVTVTAIWLTPSLRPHFPNGIFAWHGDDTAILKELFALGWPIAITTGVEAGLFVAGSLMIGTLGTTQLAAHQVTINMAATAFMVPLAISQAANVRVGYHIGSKLPA
ncbi:MAG: MATE family efflux transporter, partial [Rhodobacteraceae bacterium]|nr:MATE family efflux transporter [Paracoccaceae bacterium]